MGKMTIEIVISIVSLKLWHTFKEGLCEILLIINIMYIIAGDGKPNSQSFGMKCRIHVIIKTDARILPRAIWRISLEKEERLKVSARLHSLNLGCILWLETIHILQGHFLFLSYSIILYFILFSFLNLSYVCIFMLSSYFFIFVPFMSYVKHFT